MCDSVSGDRSSAGIYLPPYLRIEQTLAVTCSRCSEILIVPPHLSAQYYVDQLVIFAKMHNRCLPNPSIYTGLKRH
jgi:hypothetical protein